MRHKRSKPGFTLVEAIGAIVLLSIAAPAMLMAITDAQRRRSGPVLAERARWLAVERLEEVIADRHSATRGYAYLNTGNYPAESAVDGFGSFTRSVDIKETGATLSGSGTGYKIVTVSVSYKGESGANKALSIAAVVTDYTP